MKILSPTQMRRANNCKCITSKYFPHTKYTPNRASVTKINFNKQAAVFAMKATEFIGNPEAPIWVMDAADQCTCAMLMEFGIEAERLRAFTICANDFDQMNLAKVYCYNTTAEELYDKVIDENPIIIDDGMNEAAKTLNRLDIILHREFSRIAILFNVAPFRKSGKKYDFIREAKRRAEHAGYTRNNITPLGQYSQGNRGVKMSPFLCYIRR